jgi:hypothetical protein
VEPPADAVFEAGPFVVEPGDEIVMCTFARGDNVEEQDVSRFAMTQSAGGHHLIVYTVDHSIDSPPAPCPQGGQPSWTQILATQAPHEEQAFPSGVGYHVGPSQQYVIETHTINATGEVLQAKSSLSMTYATKGSVEHVAASYFFGTENIDVPAGAKGSASAACSPPKDTTLRTMFGHEHQHGTRVSVELERTNVERQPLYASEKWDAPPILTFDNGLSLSPGDSLHVRCDYDNPLTTSLRYPHEMCFVLGYYWPSDGRGIFCVSGGGKDACECQSTFTDTGPGGSRVDIEVGREDTIVGTKGDPASGAPIYCTLFRAEDYTPLGPKPDAKPYAFGSIVDEPLTHPSDRVPLSLTDVTPGDYAIVCMMDTIGGGFLPGAGDLVNLKGVVVSPDAGSPAAAEVVLDFALP